MQLTKSRRAYFKAAKAVAELSNFKQYHIGCVAVYKHKIISSGCNSNRTNPTQKKLNKHRFESDTNHTLHSETSCLIPIMNRDDIDFKNGGIKIRRKGGNEVIVYFGEEVEIALLNYLDPEQKQYVQKGFAEFYELQK